MDTNLITPLRNVLSDPHSVLFVHDGGIDKIPEKLKTWVGVGVVGVFVRFRRRSQLFLSNEIEIRFKQRTVVREMVRPEYAPLVVTDIQSLYYRKLDDSWRHHSLLPCQKLRRLRV